MIIKVRMLAFMEGEIREVNIPDDEFLPGDTDHNLERTFYYGQNDFQPVPNRCSVSAGDVIDIDGKHHLIASVGFRVMTDDDLATYETTPRGDRWLVYDLPIL